MTAWETGSPILQDEGGNLAGAVFRVVDFDPGIAVVALGNLVGDELLVLGHHLVVVTAPDQALDGEQGVFRIGHRLALGGQARQAFARVREGDHGGCGADPFRVLDHLHILAVHHGDAGVRGAQVDTDNLTHVFSPFL